MQNETISRPNLSDSAEAAVRTMIVDGALSAGEHLNEVHLAARLGVSRTPLREALNRLVAEGAVEARPRLGYFVKPLTLDEFDQLYDIRPLLDPEALRLAGLPSSEQMEQLARLNQRLVRTKNALTRIALDDEWHLALIAHCPNRVLVGMIENMMLRTRRYELAWMRRDGAADKAGDTHDVIMRALRARRLKDACAALRQNLTDAKPVIAAWLAVRQVGQGTT
ncbi:MAG TPA: GntR family transcriptional regulator [Verrucomicrobiae bacterium]|jgi:DNA-binding GntR family transcriptional regulator|nr:GntR family transcriptional regulator [Verrucomicrobiae bacterium]